jgi:flavodoxin
MKNIKRLGIIMGVVASMMFSNSVAQNPSGTVAKDLKNKKVLIIYLSRTKNTKAVAKMIHKNVGGDLVALELQNPYPEDYKVIVDQVANENATNFLPTLKTKIENIEKYDVVFIGFPTWGMQLPPPMKSFLSQYNIKGKTIIPFNTNSGYGIGSSFDKIKELCTECKILEGFSIKGGKERDGIFFVMEGEKKIEAEKEIQTWLKKIGILKN